MALLTNQPPEPAADRLYRQPFSAAVAARSTYPGERPAARAEVLAALMACAYLWEICDALGSEQWRRRITPTTAIPPIGAGGSAAADLPFVSLHVPAHNEPPDMVIQTLRTLLRLDYPRCEVILIDDNTDAETLWRPVEAWCRSHGVKFAHLEDWPGHKSGALNYALRRITDERAELIGVVDSDYQLKPGFLRRCAPLSADPWIGFIQAPQDYRDWRRRPSRRRRTPPRDRRLRPVAHWPERAVVRGPPGSSSWPILGATAGTGSPPASGASAAAAVAPCWSLRTR